MKEKRSMLGLAIWGGVENFDEKTFPLCFHSHVLRQVRSAATPTELGRVLALAFAWQDGKVRLDSSGGYRVSDSGCYRIEKPSPNVFGPRHAVVLESLPFFGFAMAVKDMAVFDKQVLLDLHKRFGLWGNLELPVFLLHCLNPKVFPIFNSWLARAWCALDCTMVFLDEMLPRMDADAYEGYQAWRLDFFAEVGGGPEFGIHPVEIGLWVFGRRMLAIALSESFEDAPVGLSSLSRCLDGVKGSVAGSAPDNQANVRSDDSRGNAPLMYSGLPIASGRPGAPRARVRPALMDEFRSIAIRLYQEGHTQREAMEMAAQQAGVELKESYVKYPGSHFDRWRKQGFLS